jgi:hypothetical protein
MRCTFSPEPTSEASVRRLAIASPRIALLLVVAAAGRLGAQAARPSDDARAGSLAFVRRAPAGVTRDRAPAVAPSAPTSPARRVAASVSASPESGTRRSRARGARNGFLIGAAVGAFAGMAITDDFYDDRAANVAIGIVSFGFLGALVGAAIGVRAP